ncbi:MAG: cytochrome c-type biogenesis protein [Vibrionaceae bacterium]
MKFVWLVLGLALYFNGAVFSVAAENVHKFASLEQERLFEELGMQLRCPECQSKNIAYSSAPLAQDMRKKVYEQVNLGKSKQQIINYMVERFGNSVSYDPPLTLGTLILWVGPLLFALSGFIWLVRLCRRRQTVVLSLAERQRVQALLHEEDKFLYKGVKNE